jgi:hypothetical protein
MRTGLQTIALEDLKLRHGLPNKLLSQELDSIEKMMAPRAFFVGGECPCS